MTLSVETEALLRETVRTVFERGEPAAVTDALADLGWDEVVTEDEPAATRLLFSEQGRCLAASAALDEVLLRAAGPAVSSVARRVAYPASGSDRIRPSGPDRLDGAVLLAPVPEGEPVLAPVARPTSRVSLVVVEIPATSQRPLSGVDPDAGWVAIAGPLRERARPLTGADAEDALARGIAAARLALACEINGVTRAALDLAVAHSATRHQFGHPISGFQAVRHRLAEAHARLCGAEALQEAAASEAAALEPTALEPTALEPTALEPTAFGAATAKAGAAAAHSEVLAHAGQVFGAIGLTWEHPSHRHLRRGLLLDGLLGSADDLVAETGRAALTGATPPRTPVPGPVPAHDERWEG